MQTETDFYPRPPRGGRRRDFDSTFILHDISIHALREEGDNLPPAALAGLDGISIHALREEGDPEHESIPAVRLYFYPRPPRGGRLQ